MEQNSNYITNFDTDLKLYHLKKNQTIYGENAENIASKSYSERQYTAKDVLSNISKQLSALQRADSMKNINSRFKNSRWKTGALEPVHLLSLKCNKTSQNVNKFETQGVSDTQLIQIVENVDNLLVPIGMTQEFENSFCEQHISRKHITDENCNNFRKENDETDNHLNKRTIAKKSLYSNNFNSELNLPHYVKITDNEEKEYSDINYDCDLVPDSAMSSLISNTNEPLTSDCHSPLIYTMDAFENFEKFAFPVIEKNTDLELVKQIINTEMKRKKLKLYPSTKIALEKKHDSPSPNSNINNLLLKTPPCNLTYKDVISKETEKIEMKSNKIFENEVLFSVEGNNEETNFHDLPLTCALETSFHSEHDSLDKTMLVGFQTASDKFIEIKTESFCKAFDILEEVDSNHLNSSLKKIVKNYNDGKNNNVNEKYVNNTSVHLLKPKKKCNVKRHDVIIIEEDTNLNKLNSCKELETVPSESSNMMPDNMKKNKDFSITIKQNCIDTNHANSGYQLVIQESYNNKKSKIVKEIENCLTSNDNNENEEEIKKEPLHIDQLLKTNFQGFKTASNKHITISEQSLARTKNIFEDCNISDNFDKNCKTLFNDYDNSFKTNFITDLVLTSKNDALSDEIIQSNEIVTEYIETESPKNMITAENKIEKSIKTFGERGFNTSDNKPMAVTSESLVTSTKLLKVAKSAIKENSINGLQNYKGTNDFASVSKNPTLENEKKIHVNEKQVYEGFKTASGKNVCISEKAVAMSKILLQDFENDKEFDNLCCNFGSKEMITDEITNTKICKNTSATSTNNNFDIEIANDNCTLSNHEIFVDKNNPSNQVFKGFHTASNKILKISDEALAKSKEILKDLEFNVNNEYFNVNQKVYPNNPTLVKCKFADDCTSSFMGEFKTESQKDNFDFFANQPLIEDQNYKMDKSRRFEGFQTASKKVIKISEKALANSKKIFQDLDPIHVNHEEIKITKTVANSKNLDESFDPVIENDELNYNTTNSILSKTHNYENIASSDKDRVFYNSNLRSKRAVFDDRFKGFQTGNNKRVKVSGEALAKSKNIFQDLSDDYKHSSVNTNELTKKVSLPRENILGSVRSTNEVALKLTMDSNKIEDTVRNDQENNSLVGELIEMNENKYNFETIMDTQVINDFQETLYTEDFCKEINLNKSKRSGSPILNPSTKKRKEFKVPYNSGQNRQSEPRNIAVKENKSIMFTFDNNYKKNRNMTMTDLKNMEKLDKEAFQVDSYILSFKYDHLLEFVFSNERNELCKDPWSTEVLKHNFLSLVKKEIVPDGWLDNHLKLIIGKLIYYEIEFKHVMRGACSVRNVLEQLKYRYDKELYNVERSALRKILEKDDVSTKTMVLRVVAIYAGGVAVSSVRDADDVELLLTDGWYCIKACLDSMLKKLVCSCKIKIGTKLATHGAELLNCEQGVAPWENTSSVRLKLFGNSTRRARWDTRLGYHKAAAILTPLSCVELGGGKVSKLRVFVTRVYPTQYVEKFEDGSTVTRSERQENLHQMKYESETQALVERLYEEVQKEFIDKDSQNSELDNDVGGGLESGSQISRLMKQSKDTGEFIENLTNTQRVMLQDYTNRRQEKVLQLMQARLLEKLKAMGLHNGRNVVALFKIRIVDVNEDGEVTKAMMTIWRPNESVLDVVKEGMWIDVLNITPTAVRCSEIQLSASRRTIFKRSNRKQCEKINCITSNLGRTCYSAKELVQSRSKHIRYDEVDTVGLVFQIDPSYERYESIKGQAYQNVYLTDADKNMICINFWGGLRKFGYEKLLDTGQVVAAMNLQERIGNTKKSILQFRATEFSYFTKTPKLAIVRKLVDDLNDSLIGTDIKKLCEECRAMKNDSIKSNGENISPYRINYSPYNVSKHRVLIDSSLTRTSNQDNIQDKSIQKNTVNAKLEKLKMYGEPPPLNFIHIINRSKNATSAFKNPLSISNDISNNVTSKHLKEHWKRVDNTPCSVITNPNSIQSRKKAKPAKLNFDKARREQNGVNVVDPFAEEFDTSLPLSLD